MLRENESLSGEVRDGQERIRLSTTQNTKLAQEYNDLKDRMEGNDQENNVMKRKMQQILQENKSLEGEFRNAQEGLRLSNAQQAKMAA